MKITVKLSISEVNQAISEYVLKNLAGKNSCNKNDVKVLVESVTRGYGESERSQLEFVGATAEAETVPDE